MLWSINRCQNKVSVDQYHMTISLAHVDPKRLRVFFFKFSADKLLVFN